MNQLAFDFMAPPPRPAPPPPCPLAEILIAKGLAPNDYILDLNRGLTNPDEIELPSRLLQFPIEFMARDRRKDGKSKLLLRHPDLAGLPFVLRVAEQVGVMPGWEPHDEFGRDRGGLPRWWHAVDLCSETHWQDLMRTANLTDPEAIMRAVGFGLHYKSKTSLKLSSARTIMSELGSSEPDDRSEAALRSKMLSPGKMTTNDRGKPLKEPYFTANLHGDAEPYAWAHIHGIEDGWFAHDGSGHMRLGKPGIARLGLS